MASSAGVDQSYVTGNIHARRAQRHAGHRIFQTAQAAVVVDVLPVVVGKAADAVEHQLGGVLTDGAGGTFFNRAGGVLDDFHMSGLGPAIQHIRQQDRQLGEAYPAGHAFAAGLGMTQVQKVQRHIHRTESRRRGGDPALHVVVELLHHHLGPVRRFDVKTAQ